MTIIQNYLYDLYVLLRCEKEYGRNSAHCCVVISIHREVNLARGRNAIYSLEIYF